MTFISHSLLVGLGNPGDEYSHTRHNAGYLFLDWLAEEHSLVFTTLKKGESSMTERGEIILAKAQTYMNESGRAVSKLLRYYKIPSDHLTVIHDDLDIPFGEYKIMSGKGPKIHNGLISIENYLQNKDFRRVRIGVDARDPEQRIDGKTYVLQPFTADELRSLRMEVFPAIAAELSL